MFDSLGATRHLTLESRTIVDWRKVYVYSLHLFPSKIWIYFLALWIWVGISIFSKAEVIYASPQEDLQLCHERYSSPTWTKLASLLKIKIHSWREPTEIPANSLKLSSSPENNFQANTSTTHLSLSQIPISWNGQLNEMFLFHTIKFWGGLLYSTRRQKQWGRIVSSPAHSGGESKMPIFHEKDP